MNDYEEITVSESDLKGIEERIGLVYSELEKLLETENMEFSQRGKIMQLNTYLDTCLVLIRKYKRE